MTGDVELREALIDLERVRNQEQQRRIESDCLLEALRILTRPVSTEKMFSEMLDVLRGILMFEDAFVLIKGASGLLVPISATSPKFLDTIWNPGSMLKRVLLGNPVVAFDISRIEEWKAQPEHIRDGVKSALHISYKNR